MTKVEQASLHVLAWLIAALVLFGFAVITRAQSNTCAQGDMLLVNTTGNKNLQCLAPGGQPAGTGNSMIIANEAVTGTTVNRLAKLTGAPSTAIIASTSDTESAVGIVSSGAGTVGNATITIMGQASCVFDGATTAGNYFTISSTSAGACHDAGSTYPTSGATYGRVLSSNGGAGTYIVELMTPDVAFQNAGNGKSKPATPTGSYQYNDTNQWGGGNLFREDANTVAQRNGTTAQTFNFYSTYSGGGTTYSRLAFKFSGSDPTIETESNGGGSGGNLLFKKGSATITFNGSTLSPSTTLGLGTGTFQWGEIHNRELWIENSGNIRFNGAAGLQSSTDGILGVVGNGNNFGNGLGVRMGDVNNTNGSLLKRSFTDMTVRTGNDDNYAYIISAGNEYVSTQFDKTNTTLANVTGLVSENLLAGKTYVFEATLFVDADTTGGSKYAIAGSATATDIRYYVEMICDATNLNVITSRQTALGGSVGQAGCTAGLTRISGTITVNAAGTLAVQFAQNAVSGTSSVLTMSKFKVERFN